MRGLNVGFLQARFVNPNFFFNIYNTWGNINNSYSIAPYTRDFWNRTHTNPPMSPDSAEADALRLGNMFTEKNHV
jgi:hypothetical protein